VYEIHLAVLENPNKYQIMKALTLSGFGSSDVLEYREVNDPILKDEEVLVKNESYWVEFC
jgi:hypothetical protein